MSLAGVAVDEGAEERPTRVHLLVLLLLAAAMANAYMCRGMGAINTTLEKELQVNEVGLSPIVTGFAAGYLWMQIPGGWLGSKFGARLVLPIICLGWSICTLIFASGHSVRELTWPRLLIGLFQGGLIPCSAKVVADWVPSHKRGMASAIVTSSMQVGALLGLSLTPFLMTYFSSWRLAYVVYGVLGIAWSVAFALVFRNHPAEHPWVNRAERELIAPLNVSPPLTADASGGWRDTALLFAILFTSSLVLMNIQAFFRAFGYEFFQSWFPAYLEKARGLTALNSSLLTMLPLVGVGLGGLVGGAMVDLIYQRTGSRWLSRSVVSATTLMICSGCTLAAAWVTSPSGAVLLITLGTFFFGFTGPTTWSALIDVSGKHTGVISGLMNMCGNLGAVTCAWSLGPLFTYIGQTKGDWNIVLYLFVAVYQIGAVVWLLRPCRVLGSGHLGIEGNTFSLSTCDGIAKPAATFDLSRPFESSW